MGPRMAGWYRKGSVPRREEGRAQRKESGGPRIAVWHRKGSAPGREQRKERREKRETSTTKISRSKDAMVRSQNGGMVQKRVGP